MEVNASNRHLNISSGFVSDFHQKFFGFGCRIFRIQKQIQNVQIDSGTQVVNVWNEDVFSSLEKDRFGSFSMFDDK